MSESRVILSAIGIAGLIALGLFGELELFSRKSHFELITDSKSDGIPTPRKGLVAEVGSNGEGGTFMFNGTNWDQVEAKKFVESYRQYQYDNRTQREREIYERDRARNMSDMNEFPGMTVFGAWSKETNCEMKALILWPSTNLSFAFLHKPTEPVFTNNAWVIHFEP